MAARKKKKSTSSSNRGKVVTLEEVAAMFPDKSFCVARIVGEDTQCYAAWWSSHANMRDSRVSGTEPRVGVEPAVGETEGEALGRLVLEEKQVLRERLAMATEVQRERQAEYDALMRRIATAAGKSDGQEP